MQAEIALEQAELPLEDAEHELLTARLAPSALWASENLVFGEWASVRKVLARL